MLSLTDILQSLTGIHREEASIFFPEASVDSRQVIPGGLFAALPGERVDGHNYVEAAFTQGAQIALIQKDIPSSHPVVDVRSHLLPAQLPEGPFCLRVDDTLKALQQIAGFYRRKFDLKVIGITGSVGKSSTKELVWEVLSQRYHTLKNQGNLNNEIGLPLTLLRLGASHQAAVLEMGFYIPGDIALLCELALPQVGILTNIGTVHAERAGSQEAIARGKSELVRALPQGGFAILNYDDPWIRPMAMQTRAQVFFYGTTPEATLWADQIQSLGLAGIHFQLHYQNESLHLRIPLIGRHSVHSALRAAAAGLVLDLSWDEIITGLQQGQSQLRLVVVHSETGALLLDDTYNASPESTLAALNLLDEMDGTHIAVLGDMLELGPYEKQGHELVGARVAETCQRLITIGTRARMIAEAAVRAGLPTEAVSWVESVPEAIDLLRTSLNAGDVVLVKGSHGMHMERIVSALEVES